ncbi:MAG: hypothetical protein R3E51_00070 [Rhizobiaceae bacterium]
MAGSPRFRRFAFYTLLLSALHMRDSLAAFVVLLDLPISSPADFRRVADRLRAAARRISDLCVDFPGEVDC